MSCLGVGHRKGERVSNGCSAQATTPTGSPTCQKTQVHRARGQTLSWMLRRTTAQKPFGTDLNTAFMVLQVHLCNQNKTVHATAMLGSSSSTSYMTDRMTDDLGLVGSPLTFTALVLGGGGGMGEGCNHQTAPLCQSHHEV